MDDKIHNYEVSLIIAIAILIIGIPLMLPLMLFDGDFDSKTYETVSIKVIDKEIIRRPEGAMTPKLYTYLIETDKGSYEVQWEEYRQLSIGKNYMVMVSPSGWIRAIL